MYPSPGEPWYGSFVKDQAEDLVALGIDVQVLDFDGRRDRRNYVRAAANLRRLVSRGDFELVHAHYGLSGVVALAQRRLPVVTTFHGSDYTGAILWQRYVSWVVARGSHAILVSEEARRALGCPTAPVIPAGVDTDLFGPIERRAARRELGWPEDGSYVLLPGSRASPGKRADLFDAAVAEARGVVPDLRGVAFEGFSRQQAVLVLNAVDVMLMTSDREGSPVTVREALACLTPVVSVEAGDVPKVLAGLPGCGIFRREPDALARGLLTALHAERDPELRRRAERTSRGAVARRVAAVYDSVLAAERP
jgi:teichuronic acid biosynthesis glycosyltransferase TuaC